MKLWRSNLNFHQIVTHLVSRCHDTNYIYKSLIPNCVMRKVIMVFFTDINYALKSDIDQIIFSPNDKLRLRIWLIIHMEGFLCDK